MCACAHACVCDTSWAAGGGGLQHTALYGFAEEEFLFAHGGVRVGFANFRSAGVVGFAFIMTAVAVIARLFWDSGGVNGRVLITRGRRRGRRARIVAVGRLADDFPLRDRVGRVVGQ